MNPAQQPQGVILGRGREIQRQPFLDSLKVKQRMISNRAADKLLVEARMGKENSPFWTKTIVAYPASGETFGSFVVYKDPRDGKRYRLDCRDFKGEGNIALLVEEYDLEYSREDMMYVYLPRREILAVENFPQLSGRYMTDGNAIPYGEEFRHRHSIMPGVDYRYLHRIRGERVGPIARGCEEEFGLRNFDVNMNYAPSVMLREPSLDLKKEIAGLRAVA